MKKIKCKEFLYPIDRDWLMGDPGDYLPLGCNDPLHLTSHNPQLFEPILPSQDYAQHNGLLPTYIFHPTDTRRNVLAKDVHPIRARD